MLQAQPELRVVGEIADVLEAVQQAQELKPDLILLDVAIPNLNGIEAANRIRQVAPGAKIIFLTQISDKDVVRTALSTGAEGYVLKTDAGSELSLAIEAVGAGELQGGMQGGSELALVCNCCGAVATYRPSDVKAGLASSDIPIGKYTPQNASN
jgi:DNA-binding NarL/FixJ family response regulator